MSKFSDYRSMGLGEFVYPRHISQPQERPTDIRYNYMEANGQTWRKRNACEKCRKQKVRCEYDSVSVRRCVRCIRTNSECIVLDRSGKRSDNSPESQVPPSRDQNSEDFTLGACKQAIRDGYYDVHEAAAFFDMFCATGQNIPVMDNPTTLCEISLKYPLTALAVITVVALTTSTKKAVERLDLVRPILTTGMNEMGMISMDSHSAFLLLSEYLLPFFEKGIMRMTLAHGSMSALQQRHGLYRTKDYEYRPMTTNTPNNTVLSRLYEFTSNTLKTTALLSKFFAPVNDIANLYLNMSRDTHPVYSLYVSQVHAIYQEAFALMRISGDSTEVWALCIRAVGQIESLPDVPPKYAVVGCITRAMLVSSAMTFSVSNCQERCLEIYLPVINNTLSAVRQFVNSFVGIHIKTCPIPIWIAYMACEAVNILWSMRIYSFATGLALDVPFEELKELIGSKWKEMLSTSYVGRQNFIAWLMTNDTIQVQVGFYNESTRRVIGCSTGTEFYCYRMLDDGTPAVTAPLDRDTLWQVCQSGNFAKRDTGMLPQTPEELIYSIPTVLQDVAIGLR